NSSKSIEGVPLPPEGIFFKNRNLEESIQQGIANVDYVRASGANVEDGLILDIGCGYGRFAYGLLNAGFQGLYVGVDIVEQRIAWLTENFAKVQPHYGFHFLGVRNNLNNPDGQQTQLSYHDILKGDAPDTIVLFSVFSHMYGEDIQEHLKSIAEIMSPASKLLFSCFLYDGVATEGVRSGRTIHKFQHELAPDCRCDKLDEPLKAIAYSETFLRGALDQAGLTGEIFRGGWSGFTRSSRLPTSQLPGWPGYQDWIVAAKA
ncbi:MAG TPA: class I SAM-dependent methyltransferase, partial [Methyloceanibacter sp.]|nr:class I SAM-dependent methyltransferase [Methyloceanibacter sp.]